jgi:hypothetical protein
MLDVFSTVYAEGIKLKHSGVFWLSTAGTLFTNLMMGLIPFNFPIIADYLEMDPVGSWEGWIRFHYLGILPMLLPMFLVILCALSILTETRSGSWKMLYSLPIPRSLIYLSKLKVIALVFTFSHILFLLVMSVIPLIVGLDFEYFPIILLIKLAIGTILSCMGILGILFLVAYYSRSLILQLAVGILGFVLAQLIRDYQLGGEYFPFSWPSLTITAVFDKVSIFKYLALSMACFLIATIGGMWWTKKDRTKNC